MPPNPPTPISAGDTQLINQSLKAIAAAMGLVAQNIANTFPNWVTVPATATSPGVAGQVAYAPGSLYVCVSSNTWQKVTLVTF